MPEAAMKEAGTTTMGTGTTPLPPPGIAGPLVAPGRDQERDEERSPKSRRSLVERAWRLARQQPLGTLGLAILLAIAVAAALAPVIAPYSPTEFLPYGPYAAPGPGAILGTDQLGRDLLTRILWGARASLLIATVATLSGLSLGVAIGLISGYCGGRVDLLVQRAMDIFDAFPSLVLAILFVAMLGPSARNVTLAVALVMVPGANRVARAIVLGLRAQPFVEAAFAIGASPMRVALRHIAPGLVAPLIIVAASAFSGVIIAEASLSFLGLGPPPPTATWGQLLAGEVRQHFVDAPWVAFFPGFALSLTIFAIVMIGDALRDIFDPRTR
jgi:peptide/nickel transport system permease protein